MVELHRARRTFAELAAEFGCKELVDPAMGQAGGSGSWRGDGGLTTAEREELTRLRRENRTLRQERDILSKAAAWFANEKPATPKRCSDS
jgi:transposase